MNWASSTQLSLKQEIFPWSSQESHQASYQQTRRIEGLRSQKMWSDLIKGNDYDKDLMTEFYHALALDIASEKKRWLLTNQKPGNFSTNHIPELEETGL